MKYVIMFTSRPELDAAVPPERLDAVYAATFKWFEDNAAAFADNGAELQPPSTATTVRAADDGGSPVVVDGPFSEAKESIGGFSIIDVPDLDAAIGLAKTWPSLDFPGVAVEIRPIVDHSGHM
ncbi:MAG TPA: YciI family protein [Candidatus Limnocylindria bacterium]|nr:YciI family protein [Candidatus Limnocylindria bacterium]